MKKIILLAILVVFAFSCSKDKKGDSKDASTATSQDKTAEAQNLVPDDKKGDNTVSPQQKYNKKDEGKIITKTDSSADRDKIVNFAKKFEDKRIPKSDKWNKYASGFIKMVYLQFGVNLTDVEKKKDEDGKWLSSTQQIYNYIEENGTILKGNNPKIGDIVFFDNTYDVNKDGVWNDKLTSIGIVIEIDKEGTIYFLHNTNKGVKLKVMNMKHPEQDKIKNKNVTKTINTKMRWLTKKEKADPISDKYPTLASQNLNTFASILDKKALSELAYHLILAESERESIAKFARKFEDKDIPKSGKWNKYASGFVKMVFLSKMVDLTDVEKKKDEDGKWLSTTQMIYNFVEANGKLHKDQAPKAGDIVFLDNTFDKDKDGEFNDKLTSIGIIVEFDKADNTIYFLYKTSKGVKLKMMNLKHPEQDKVKNKNVVKTINSQMRWLTKKEKAKEGSDKFPVLSSQMLNNFGSIFK